MCSSVLENKCQIILEMSVLPSLRAKIVYTVWEEIPCLVFMGISITFTYAMA